MKKILSVLLTVVLAFPLLNINTFAVNARYEFPEDINAECYLLVSLDTGEVIFEKNSDKQWTQASLTKMMTSLLTFEYIEDLDNTMITAPRYIYDELYGYNSSTADIRQGEILSARQLLYAMMLPSANEAANIMADYLGKGDTKSFIMMMNNKAKKLGMDNTMYSNPHGLFPENQYTTAWDMYLLAKECYNTPGFMDIATTEIYQMPENVQHASPYWIQSTIRMQSKTSPYYRSYINGMKTGSLPEADHNFVTICEDNGEKYVLVVLGAKYQNDVVGERPAFRETINIMDHFFGNYTLKAANDLELPVTEVHLKYASDLDTLLLYPVTSVMSVLPNDVDDSSFQKQVTIPDFVGAPVKRGDVIGRVDYFLAGEHVGTSDLVCTVDVERSTFIYLFDKMKEAVGSLYFKVALILTIILTITYIIIAFIHVRKQEKLNKVMRKK